MLGVALFEGSFRWSDEVLSYGVFGCCNFSVVYDAGSETIVFQEAGSFFAAVASMCCGGLISVQYFLVCFLMIFSILSMHE